MKILETIFFYLSIVVPVFFLFIMILNYKRMSTKPKYRNRLIKFFLVSLVINLAIFGGLKMINTKNSTTEGSNNSSYENPNRVDESNAESTSESTNQNIREPNNDASKPSTSTSDTTSKGFKVEVKNGVTYVDGYMIANKTYPLPADYVPSNTHKKITNPDGACAECIIEDAYMAFASMKKDASANGLTLWIQSGYRAYKYQEGLYNSYVKNRGGKEKADTFSARPGHSEHQTGYAFDLNTIDSSFANTKEGIWVNENCIKYGFIIRYPKGKDNETGYKYEPWHLRYVGVELASKLYNNGDWITMEDYFGITSEYAN